jgi:hypothetical protein
MLASISTRFAKVHGQEMDPSVRWGDVDWGQSWRTPKAHKRIGPRSGGWSEGRPGVRHAGEVATQVTRATGGNPGGGIATASAF